MSGHTHVASFSNGSSEIGGALVRVRIIDQIGRVRPALQDMLDSGEHHILHVNTIYFDGNLIAAEVYYAGTIGGQP